MSLFLRLLEDENRGVALEAAVQSIAKAEPDARVFEVDPTSFEQVPGAPFAYWVSDSIRGLFLTTQAFESSGRVAQHGCSSKDDFRYLRLAWEVEVEPDAAGRWTLFAKGGEYSPYYSNVHLCINWYEDARELEADLLRKYPYLGESANWVLHRECNYFLPGLTWPRRTTSGLALRAMPAGCIFADKGPAAFIRDDDPRSLLTILALTNSAPFSTLVSLQIAAADAAARSYEVGIIQRTPVPELPAAEAERLALLARNAWAIKRDLDTAELTSHAFVLPALLQVDGADLAARLEVWSVWLKETGQALVKLQAEIDERCFDLYGFDDEDRAAALDANKKTSAPSASLRCNSPADLAAELFDWLIGVAFGRFDVRLATGEREEPKVPEPFDPLPVCSPGMLTGNDGLPLDRPPPGYPLEFPADGILVDDAGIDDTAPSEADVIRRVQQIVKILTAETQSTQRDTEQCSSQRSLHLFGESFEVDLCKLLSVRSLRDWLRRPTGYFADHLSRYSKSRRKAPILWPLSTESGSYTLWIYYPRLTDQTLYSCVNLHIDPKLQEIERDLSRLLSGGQADPKTQKHIDALVELQRELKSMREELLRIAKLPYKPDQNDGVLITAAPLWRLF